MIIVFSRHVPDNLSAPTSGLDRTILVAWFFRIDGTMNGREMTRLIALLKAWIARLQSHQRTLHEGAMRLDEMDAGSGLGSLFSKLFGRSDKK